MASSCYMNMCLYENVKVCFRRLLLKQRGDRAKWEYPFAVAGINISFMLIQMLDLQNTRMFLDSLPFYLPCDYKISK